MNTKSLMVIHGELDDRADFDGDVPFFVTAANPHKKYVVFRNAGHRGCPQPVRDVFPRQTTS